MISVIIPAYNASQTLPACLKALQQQIDPGRPVEIIVVDNNSTDQTAQIATEMGANVIHCPTPGPAAARNAGLAHAQGDIICFTDADCQPTANWLLQLTAPLTDQPDLTACKGSYRTAQPQLMARFVQLEYEDKYDLLRTQTHINFIDTYSAAYRREVLLKNQGFDERFLYLEDQELSFRLARQGHQMVFQPGAVVYHRHAASIVAYVRKKFLIGYWKAQVIRLHPERFQQDSHTPQVMKVQMGLILLWPLWLLLMVFSPAASALLLALNFALFTLTTLPFVAKAWPKDATIALLSPVFLTFRAMALSLGYLWGVIHPQPFTQTKPTPSASAPHA